MPVYDREQRRITDELEEAQAVVEALQEAAVAGRTPAERAAIDAEWLMAVARVEDAQARSDAWWTNWKTNRQVAHKSGDHVEMFAAGGSG
jgi:hypothetical protein